MDSFLLAPLFFLLGILMMVVMGSSPLNCQLNLQKRGLQGTWPPPAASSSPLLPLRLSKTAVSRLYLKLNRIQTFDLGKALELFPSLAFVDLRRNPTLDGLECRDFLDRGVLVKFDCRAASGSQGLGRGRGGYCSCSPGGPPPLPPCPRPGSPPQHRRRRPDHPPPPPPADYDTSPPLPHMVRTIDRALDRGAACIDRTTHFAQPWWLRILEWVAEGLVGGLAGGLGLAVGFLVRKVNRLRARRRYRPFAGPGNHPPMSTTPRRPASRRLFH